MQPIRVCHCIDDLTAGGAQQVVRHLVTNLDPSRFQPVVYTFWEGLVADAINRAGITVRVIKRNIPKLDPRLVGKIRKCLAEDRVAILHTHFFGATMHGMIAARKMPTLLKIVTLHSDREDNLLQRIGYPFLFSQAARVISVSQHASQKLRERYRNLDRKLILIPNGIEVGAFSNIGEKAFIRAKLDLPINKKLAGTIGRLSIEKGHGLLLDAFAKVRETNGEAYLVIIGGGVLRHSLQNRVDVLNLNDSVKFLGEQVNIPELLRALDVFVMSSYQEGLPIALLEAMASGVPIVATKVGGIPEVVKDRQEGLLVPSGNAELLAQAISTLLNNPTLGERLAEKAFHRVGSDYSVEHMVREHERLYELLAHNHSRSHSGTVTAQQN